MIKFPMVPVPDVAFNDSMYYLDEMYVNETPKLHELGNGDFKRFMFNVQCNQYDRTRLPNELIEQRNNLNMFWFSTLRFRFAEDKYNVESRYLLLALRKMFPKIVSFIISHIYSLDVIPNSCDLVEFKGFEVRQEVIGYLSHVGDFSLKFHGKYTNDKYDLSQDEVIGYFKEVFLKQDKEFDFDEYISNWVERLLNGGDVK